MDEPVAWYVGADASQRRWLHADRQGSIIAWSDDQGRIQAAYTYGPFGEPSDWTGPRFRYTGQVVLPEAQAYFYKARVYDPVMGRFLQTDPIGQKDDPNLYAYVRDDPTDKTDPTGTQLADLALGVLHGTGWTVVAAGNLDSAAGVGGTHSAGVFAGRGPAGDLRVGLAATTGPGSSWC